MKWRAGRRKTFEGHSDFVLGIISEIYHHTLLVVLAKASIIQTKL